MLATAAALAQTRLSAARAAVIMTMEPVFAALFGLLAGQFLSARQIIGCCLVLAAMFLVEPHMQGRKDEGRVPATEP
ncbi:EamA family transporter [Streptomyces sp. NPDC002573]|uniref:EamA family transporter n=1 Tax=Streptomyces sp. NPDC002573 TaxID=3364651 RepID=UPI00368E3D38